MFKRLKHNNTCRRLKGGNRNEKNRKGNNL